MDYLAGEVLVFDKPLNWTSFDLVNKVRWLLKRKLGVKKIKVGHAGTLDPLATGLVVICTGKATKQIEQYFDSEKEYIATFTFGATTPSYDLETEIDETFPTDHITRKLIEEKLTTFIGKIEQIPPVYSAIKMQGKRAYEFARKNQDVKMEPRQIEIMRFEMIDYNFPNVDFKIVCSKGTYIRSLARDLGHQVNSGAHLTALRRTRSGNFSVDDAISIDEFEKKLNNFETN